jgi:hypothetical protein
MLTNIICANDAQASEVLAYLEGEGYDTECASEEVNSHSYLNDGAELKACAIYYDTEDATTEVESYIKSSLAMLVRSLRESWPSEERTTYAEWKANHD